MALDQATCLESTFACKHPVIGEVWGFHDDPCRTQPGDGKTACRRSIGSRHCTGVARAAASSRSDRFQGERACTHKPGRISRLSGCSCEQNAECPSTAVRDLLTRNDLRRTRLMPGSSYLVRHKHSAPPRTARQPRIWNDPAMHGSSLGARSGPLLPPLNESILIGRQWLGHFADGHIVVRSASRLRVFLWLFDNRFSRCQRAGSPTEGDLPGLIANG